MPCINICQYYGESCRSEQYLRQHINENHIADTDTLLKRELSTSSKTEPIPTHGRPNLEVDNSNTQSAQIESLNEKVFYLECLVKTLNKEAEDKNAMVEEYKNLVIENQGVVEELLEKNTNLEENIVEMLQTNTLLENEMLEKNFEIVKNIVDAIQEGTRI